MFHKYLTVLTRQGFLLTLKLPEYSGYIMKAILIHDREIVRHGH